MPEPQPFYSGAYPSLLCEATNTPMSALYLDADAIVSAHRAFPGNVSPQLLEATGKDFALPRVAALGYVHLTTIGAVLDFPYHGEPKPRPVVKSPDEVGNLREPASYMASGLMPERLRLAERVAELWGEGLEVWQCLGDMHVEGPVTTALLLVGQDFLLWPYEYPEAAHALLDFVTISMANYVREVDEAQTGKTEHPSFWLADDFAGMFPPDLFREFALPYWDKLYRLLGARRRIVHSELLRPAHLPLLAEIGINSFDPGADQYLTPEILQEQCPCRFHLRLLSWHLRANDIPSLLALYRHCASFHPVSIQIGIEMLSEEEKFLALWRLATEMAEG